MNNDVILNWLKTKINYVYFEHSNDEDLCRDKETSEFILVNKNKDLVLTCSSSIQDNQEENFIIKWKFLKGKAHLSSYTTVNTTFLSTEKGDFILDCAIKNTITNATTKVLFKIKVEDTLLANPGKNQTVNINQIIKLDASGSKNIPGLDNSELSYTWSFQNRPKGSAVILSDKSSKNPTFLADIEGKYIVQLIVKNKINKSEPKFVTINIISETSFFTKKLSKLLIASRIHFSDLEASESYLVIKQNDNIHVEPIKANHNRYTFENFNRKINEYVYDTEQLIRMSRSSNTKHSIQNYATLLLPLIGLKESQFQKSNKKFFFNLPTTKINHLIQNTENLMQNKNLDFQDFQSNITDEITTKSSNLEEMGIFYPFEYKHDIFAKKYYLLEINHIQLIKDDETLIDKKQKFYKEYEVKGNHNYFATASTIYNKEFAYFDPFFYLKNFKKEHTLLIKNIEANKMDTSNFTFDLFEFFNLVQFQTVRFQHENLINLIMISRSKKRQLSLPELCNKIIKDMEKHPNKYYDEKTYTILFIFREFLNKHTYTNSLTINDLGFANMSDESKSDAQNVLNNLLLILNKGNISNLSYISNYTKSRIKIVFKKYKLNNDSISTIENIIKSIIVFHCNLKKEKFSKRINSTLYSIYLKKQHLDFSNLYWKLSTE